MKDNKTFDTNILVYAFGKQNDKRKHVAKDIISDCNIISLQVINETAYVLLRKFNFDIIEVEKVVRFVNRHFLISDLNMNIFEQTLKIADKYGFSFWDSMIIASALKNQCNILFSEDLNHGQMIESKLTLINPFLNITIKL
jgi:predicted nucleic acid-binding protein